MAQRSRSLLTAALCAATLLAAPTGAQSTRPSTAIERSVEREVEPHFGSGLLGFVDQGNDERRRLWEERELGFRVLYAPLLQTANGDSLVKSSLDVYGAWERVFDAGWLGLGGFDLYFQYRKDDVIGPTTVRFSDDLGLQGLTNQGDVNGTRTDLAQLSWIQRMARERLTLRVGQLNPESLFSENAFAGNDRESFVSQVFSSNPTGPVPAAGLGLGAWYAPSKVWYFGGAVLDGDPRGGSIDFDSLSSDNLARLGEIGLTPDVVDMGRGHYRFTYSAVDGGDDGPESDGWAISIDQEMGDAHGIFFRWSYGDGKRTRLDQVISTGVVFTQAFGFVEDQLGIGLFWDSPSVSGLQEEFGVETFWRLWLTQRVNLTPALYVLRPSDKSADTRAVFSVRLAIDV